MSSSDHEPDLDARARLTLLVDAAAADLASVTGATSACARSKAGESVPAIKYHEGRWAALREVARCCDRTGEEADAVAGSVHVTWAEDLARLRDRSAGADWIAYRVGGIDALASVTEAGTVAR